MRQRYGVVKEKWADWGRLRLAFALAATTFSFADEVSSCRGHAAASGWARAGQTLAQTAARATAKGLAAGVRTSQICHRSEAPPGLDSSVTPPSRWPLDCRQRIFTTADLPLQAYGTAYTAVFPLSDRWLPLCRKRGPYCDIDRAAVCNVSYKAAHCQAV
jgi:hypothetical protein